jgi:hypothetical protein
MWPAYWSIQAGPPLYPGFGIDQLKITVALLSYVTVTGLLSLLLASVGFITRKPLILE